MNKMDHRVRALYYMFLVSKDKRPCLSSSGLKDPLADTYLRQITEDTYNLLGATWPYTKPGDIHWFKEIAESIVRDLIMSTYNDG